MGAGQGRTGDTACSTTSRRSVGSRDLAMKPPVHAAVENGCRLDLHARRRSVVADRVLRRAINIAIARSVRSPGESAPRSTRPSGRTGADRRPAPPPTTNLASNPSTEPPALPPPRRPGHSPRTTAGKVPAIPGRHGDRQATEHVVKVLLHLLLLPEPSRASADRACLRLALAGRAPAVAQASALKGAGALYEGLTRTTRRGSGPHVISGETAPAATLTAWSWERRARGGKMAAGTAGGDDGVL